MPFLIALASCGFITGVALNFDYLDQTNAAVPFMILLAPHAADVDVNGIT